MVLKQNVRHSIIIEILFTDYYMISNILSFYRNDPGRNLRDGDRMIVTGWGRVTNNKIAALTNLNKFSASTRTLRKLTVQHANNKCSNQDVFNIDKRLQMCAGGRIGEFERKRNVTF